MDDMLTPTPDALDMPATIDTPAPDAPALKKTRGKRRTTHHNVEAALHVAQALQLRLNGYTYQRIAQNTDLGYRSRAAAFNAIQRELQRQIAPVAEQVREVELLRLDQLLTVFYAKALKGDGWSMDRVLRIMERRAAYLGLDAAVQVNVATADASAFGATKLLEQMQDDPHVIEAADRFLAIAAASAAAR